MIFSSGQRRAIFCCHCTTDYGAPRTEILSLLAELIVLIFLQKKQDRGAVGLEG
jgi:hypothetical protein